MSNNHPYPAAEYCRPPQDPVDVIEDELRIYPDAYSLRQGIVAISRIYKRTQFLLCAEKYAFLMQVAQGGTANDATGRPGLDKGFFAGEVFATHTLLKTVDKPTRQTVLSTDILQDYCNGPTDIDPDNVVLRQAVEELFDFRNHSWPDIMKKQDPRLQEKLIDTAARVYQDVPNANTSRNSFIAGYLFSGNLMATCVDLNTGQ